MQAPQPHKQAHTRTRTVRSQKYGENLAVRCDEQWAIAKIPYSTERPAMGWVKNSQSICRNGIQWNESRVSESINAPAMSRNDWQIFGGFHVHVFECVTVGCGIYSTPVSNFLQHNFHFRRDFSRHSVLSPSTRHSVFERVCWTSQNIILNSHAWSSPQWERSKIDSISTTITRCLHMQSTYVFSSAPSHPHILIHGHIRGGLRYVQIV